MNNVVAKTLLVLQLVLSLCFMCFAGAVYTFQKGWRDKAEASAKQVAGLQLSLTDQQSLRASDKVSFDADLKLQKDRADQADARIQGLDVDLQQARASLASAEQERDKYQADLLVVFL